MDLGLSSLRDAEASLVVPVDWAASMPDDFSELTAIHESIELNDDHREDLRFLRAKYREGEPIPVHTGDLSRLHEAKNKPGVFKTISPCTDLSKPNAFMWPRPTGWMVYRFGRGTPEADTWHQDGIGWTRCPFGCSASVADAAETAGALETDDGYFLPDDSVMTAFVRALGVELAPAGGQYFVTLKKGKVIIKTPHGDGVVPDGWAVKGKSLIKVFPNPAPPPDVDHLVRHFETEDGTDAGDAYFADDGTLKRSNRQRTKDVLTSLVCSNPEVLLGRAARKPWRLVAIPFAPEYPGGRVQNLFAAQLAEKPARNPNPTPTWDKILSHVGRGLDKAVLADPWCRKHNVTTGADWLFLWIASLIQHPEDSLPYLFLFGPQNGGKTSLPDAFRLLMTKGVADVEEALTSSSGFNGSMAGAVLCLIEETYIGANTTAYTRLKKFTTGHRLTVRNMYCNPIELPNYSHFIQTSNDVEACPIFEGDTRIVMLEVSEIPPDDRMRWKDLEALLIAERADFLGRLVAAELPPSNERLFLPVLDTDAKRQVMTDAPETSGLAEAIKPLAGRTMRTKEIFAAIPDGIAADVPALGKMMRGVGAKPAGKSTWLLPE